jgi:hypothetical protein
VVLLFIRLKVSCLSIVLRSRALYDEGLCSEASESRGQRMYMRPDDLVKYVVGVLPSGSERQ